MKSNKLLVAGILLLSVASIAVPTIAGEAGKNCESKHHSAKWTGHDGFAGREFRHVGKALALTDAQKETLKAQREADETARNELQAKLANARGALATAVDTGANDAELNALADTLGKLYAEQALAGAKAKQAFLGVLTEEQKQTLAEAKTKRLERKTERKEARESTRS
jgi:protein CpxP